MALGRFKVTSRIEGRGKDVTASLRGGGGFLKFDIVVGAEGFEVRREDWKTRTGQPVCESLYNLNAGSVSVPDISLVQLIRLL